VRFIDFAAKDSTRFEWISIAVEQICHKIFEREIALCTCGLCILSMQGKNLIDQLSLMRLSNIILRMY
jgi:hypothetical protein